MLGFDVFHVCVEDRQRQSSEYRETMEVMIGQSNSGGTLIRSPLREFMSVVSVLNPGYKAYQDTST